MHRFLKMKHWQIFLFCFGIPILLQVIVPLTMKVLLYKTTAKEDFIPSQWESSHEYLLYSIPIILISVCFYLGWFWSVGVKLQDKIPTSLKRNSIVFSVLLWMFLGLCLYFFYSRILFFSTINLNRTIGWDSIDYINKIYQIRLIIILIILYLSFYTAKTIKTVELQQKANVLDFVKGFLLIVFLPIGIWFLQPKINEIYEAKDHEIYIRVGSN